MRLRPYTTVLPKPLMPVGDRPILDIIVRQLSAQGFERLTIVTGHLAELIEAFFGDGERFGIPIDYFREEEPLGTVGALRLLDGLDEDFLVMNGDVLTDLAYGEFLDAAPRLRRRRQHRRPPARGPGLARRARVRRPEDDARLTGYVEKPTYDYEVSMGVYAFAPRALEQIEPNERLDFPDLVLRLLEAGEVVRADRSEDYWLDIGRHDDYETAMDEFERMRDRFLPRSEARGPRDRLRRHRRLGDRAADQPAPPDGPPGGAQPRPLRRVARPAPPAARLARPGPHLAAPAIAGLRGPRAARTACTSSRRWSCPSTAAPRCGR